MKTLADKRAREVVISTLYNIYAVMLTQEGKRRLYWYQVCKQQARVRRKMRVITLYDYLKYRFICWHDYMEVF